MPCCSPLRYCGSGRPGESPSKPCETFHHRGHRATEENMLSLSTRLCLRYSHVSFRLCSTLKSFFLQWSPFRTCRSLKICHLERSETPAERSRKTPRQPRTARQSKRHFHHRGTEITEERYGFLHVSPPGLPTRLVNPESLHSRLSPCWSLPWAKPKGDSVVKVLVCLEVSS